MKINKLWSSVNFLQLNNECKLLYLHLLTHPELNDLGVITLNVDVSMAQLNYKNSLFRTSLSHLMKCKMIDIVNSSGTIYIVIVGYYSKEAKSIVTKERIIKKLKVLPEEVAKKFLLHNKVDLKVKTIPEPTVQEVSDYAIANGYDVNGNDFVNYYKGMAEALGHESGFYDKNGKKVIDWKSKMRRVWFKETNKIKAVKNAPKGQEQFSVKLDNGSTVYPDYWKDGIPRSKDFATDMILKQKFGTHKESENSKTTTGAETKSVTSRRRQSTANN